MKTSGGSKALKNELENRGWYRAKLKEVNNKIEVVWNDYVGVKGVRYDAVRGSPSDSMIAETKLTLGENFEELLKERERIKAQIRHIDDILNAMDKETRQAAEMICCEGKSYEQVARLHNISPTGLWKRIDKALEEYEKRMHTPK